MQVEVAKNSAVVPLVDAPLVVVRMMVPSVDAPLMAIPLVVGQIEHNTNHFPPFYIIYYMHRSIKGEIDPIKVLCPFLINRKSLYASPLIFLRMI